MKPATKAIHDGEEPNLKEGGTGDVVVPIHLSTTFAREKTDVPTAGLEYSRSGNPTRLALEKKLAGLENAKHGLAFSSGLGAQTTVLLSTLKSGDHVVAFDDLYGGSRRLLSQVFAPMMNVEISFVDATNTENVKQAMKDNTKLIWMESPTNPLLKLCGIKAIAEIAKENNALLVVDNTFMSPVFQQPLALGADIVVHSTTKYINGHSDSVGGAMMTNKDELHEKILFNQNAAGAIMSPFDSYLVARGLKTLHVRMQQHEQSAQKVAEFLGSHDKVTKVNYPGLQNHPQHSLAKEQMTGFGGMISFEVKGGLEESKTVLEAFKIFALAESLGGVESLAEHPALMTHASVPKEEREKIGVSDSLIRLSVGIEDVDDIIEDIKQALEKI